jgi:hypothetical protein
MNEHNLKVGDKLYELTYLHTSQGWKKYIDVYTISKITEKFVHMKGFSWKIKREEIGEMYFTSRIKMYENAIRISELDRIALKRKISNISTEINYLKKRIAWLKKNGETKKRENKT